NDSPLERLLLGTVLRPGPWCCPAARQPLDAMAIEKLGQFGYRDDRALANLAGRDLAGGDQLVKSGTGEAKRVGGIFESIREPRKWDPRSIRLLKRNNFGSRHHSIHPITDARR